MGKKIKNNCSKKDTCNFYPYMCKECFCNITKASTQSKEENQMPSRRAKRKY